MRNIDDFLFLSKLSQTVVSRNLVHVTIEPASRISQNLKMSINRLPTVDLQNILSQTQLSKITSSRSAIETHLRTSTKRNHQVHLCLQTYILPLFTSRRLKRQCCTIIMNRNIHEQIQRRRRELQGFDPYFSLISSLLTTQTNLHPSNPTVYFPSAP